jgi:hypothetical protein
VEGDWRPIYEVLVPSRLGAKRQELIRWGVNETYDLNPHLEEAVDTLTRTLLVTPSRPEEPQSGSGEAECGGVEEDPSATAPLPPLPLAGEPQGSVEAQEGASPSGRAGPGDNEPPERARPESASAANRQLKLDLE